MISTESVQTIIGRDAYGPDGDKIGTIGQVYLDNASGAPEWVTVKTGFFGTHESFVPLRDAELSGDGVLFPYDKERVKRAPHLDAERELSPEEEISLYEYYGISSDFGGFTETHDTGEHGEHGGYGSGDAMTRSEEQVRTGAEQHAASRARLRKYVVSEQQQVTVPVTREEVRVEREPITDANRAEAMSGPELSEAEHEVIVTEERPVVQKETVPVERVRLAKDQVTDDEVVDVDVRQERIETEAQAQAQAQAGRDRRSTT